MATLERHSETFADLFRKVCGMSKKVEILGPKSRKKIVKIFDLRQQKNRKKVLGAVKIDDRKCRHRALREGKKIVNFSTFWRVKEKNVLFSG